MANKKISISGSTVKLEEVGGVGYEYNLSTGAITITGKTTSTVGHTLSRYCATAQCYDCTTVNCTQVNCTTIQCTQVNCTQVNCTTNQCSGHCSGNCSQCKNCKKTQQLCYDCKNVV